MAGLCTGTLHVGADGGLSPIDRGCSPRGSRCAPGTLSPMPDDEPTPDRDDDDGPVFTGFGIGSAVLGVLAVAADRAWPP